MARGQKPKGNTGKFVIEHISVEHIEDELTPPPPHLTSNFKTLQDWLFNMCENDRPKKSVAEFRVGFFESSREYTVFLVGVNTYSELQNHSVTRVEFEPSNVYFKLPRTEYQKLSLQQVQEKLTAQVKDFTKTKSFKTSFLAKADAITMTFSGEKVWSK